MNEIRLSVLSDNVAGNGFLGEWGFSLFIERGNTRILFDTGAGMVITRNAHALGIDITAIDTILLSHGHADHTGGLREVITGKHPVEVIGHPDVWGEKYVRLDDGSMVYAGIPFQREELETLGMVFQGVRKPHELGEGILTSGEIPQITDYENIEEDLFTKDGRGFSADSMNDDVSLFIETKEGLVIITGCAHRGVINILHQARKVTGVQAVKAIIGGIHLFRGHHKRVRKTIDAFKKWGIETIVPCHCSGFSIQAALSIEMPEVFRFSSTGTIMLF